MKNTVFISGPILGMENEQGYRDVITKICVKLGLDVIDPWRREKILYKGDEKCWWDNVPAYGFIQRDLDDIDRSDIIIAYLPKLSAGACMELFYAKRKGKQVIVVSEMEHLSPWIKYHSDMIIKRLDELESALKMLITHSTSKQ
ncbi:MAG: nucleoside 2-deoxyribosyltransferase [Candidatus Bathyarchaeota archaeon]|nr:nucleoside 2-deoxyribosyltransferase [Candidatus Bathyarchaeota archaeon]